MDNNLEAHDVGFVIPDIVEIMLNKTWKNTPTNLTWGEEEKTLRDGLLNSLKNANLEEVAGVDIQLVDCLEEQELQIWVDECPDLQGLDWLICTSPHHTSSDNTAIAFAQMFTFNFSGEKVFDWHFLCRECCLLDGVIPQEVKEELAVIASSEAQTKLSDLWEGLGGDVVEDTFWDKTKKSMASKASSYLPMKDCKHHRQEFTWKCKDTNHMPKLYATASSDRKTPVQGQLQPRLQVWLASTHMSYTSNRVWTSPNLHIGAVPIPEDNIPAIYVEWPDMGILPLDEIRPIVKYVVAQTLKFRHGLATGNTSIEKVIEIGCIGAHGRTGTFMALVLVEYGYSAEEAVRTVRRDYCKHAIESKGQEKMVEEYADQYPENQGLPDSLSIDNL